jgi:flavin-binding protein dodecin
MLRNHYSAECVEGKFCDIRTKEGRGILRGCPDPSVFGFRAARPHISGATLPGKLECKEAHAMSIARVTELSATSQTGFEDAINQAVARATKTLRGVEGAWVKDMNVLIEDGNIVGYKVNVEITFVLEE